MTIDDLPAQPEKGDEPLEHMFREVFELVDKYVDTITDAEVDDRLRRLLASGALPTGPARPGTGTCGTPELTDSGKARSPREDPTAVEQHAAEIAAETHASFDKALDQATALVAAAHTQAERIVAEARQQAEQIVTEAKREAERINATARYSAQENLSASSGDLADANDMLRRLFPEQKENIPPLRVRIVKRPYLRCPTASQTVARVEQLRALTMKDERQLSLLDSRSDAPSAVRSVKRKRELAEQLVNVIGMTNEEAHDEASVWEGVVSDMLACPTRSLHGDRIPSLVDSGRSVEITALAGSSLVGWARRGR